MNDSTELAQRLKAAALNATGAHERLSVMPEGDLFDISLAEGNQLDADITALNSFHDEATPANVLALVEALEARDKQIAEDVQIKVQLCLESNSLFDRLRAAEKRNAELEANQQKIESMSAFSDERLQEIEKHRDNSLLGDLPADLARELRQTRSRLGNYYELLRRTDVAERKVSNLTVALRANGVAVEGVNNE